MARLYSRDQGIRQQPYGKLRYHKKQQNTNMLIPRVKMCIQPRRTYVPTRYYPFSSLSPVQSDQNHMVKSCKNRHFQTWPNISVTNVNKHLTTTIATAKGNLARKRKNYRSIETTCEPDIEHDDNINPEIKQFHFLILISIRHTRYHV